MEHTHTNDALKQPPLIILVAPNGARKTKDDHPNIPLTTQEIAYEATSCLDAGAHMIHLHVRNKDQSHSLNTEYYQDAIDAIKQSTNNELLIQVTSEACGIYQPEQQIAMIKELKPEAVSVAIREFFPSPSYESTSSACLLWMHKEHIAPQYILYSKEDLLYFQELISRGVIPGDHHFVLFVLGRYSKNQHSSPTDLLEFLTALADLDCKNRLHWAVCAFGKQEASCMLTSSLFDGHVRIGFENNMYLRNGQLAKNNAELIGQFVDLSHNLTKRPLATKDEAKNIIFAR